MNWFTHFEIRLSKRAILFVVSIFISLFCCFDPAHAQQAAVRFSPKQLTLDANEGIDLADVNGDQKLDVIAGRNWYAGPEFVARPLRSISDWNGYVESNGDFAYDVNGDGNVDVVAGSFIPTQVHWYENPGATGLKLGQLWKQRLLVDTGVSQNEISFLRDLDSDGTPEWITNSWNGKNPVLVWQFAVDDKQHVLKKRVVGNMGQGHGMGFGDVNNDGREDIVTATGWYERPQQEIWSKPWKFHPDWNLGSASCPILIRDLDGDGKNDLIFGNGHDYGLHWWQATGTVDDDGRKKLNFVSHKVDDRFSQPHAIHFADLDGDGVDELISGKRVRAHNGGDPGGKEMPCMYYYKWNPDQKSFQRHVIDEGHIGTGLQIRTGDLNGDGRTDIAVAGKDGTWILFNKAANADK